MANSFMSHSVLVPSFMWNSRVVLNPTYLSACGSHGSPRIAVNSLSLSFQQPWRVFSPEPNFFLAA